MGSWSELPRESGRVDSVSGSTAWSRARREEAEGRRGSECEGWLGEEGMEEMETETSSVGASEGSTRRRTTADFNDDVGGVAAAADGGRDRGSASAARSTAEEGAVDGEEAADATEGTEKGAWGRECVGSIPGASQACGACWGGGAVRSVAVRPAEGTE